MGQPEQAAPRQAAVTSPRLGPFPPLPPQGYEDFYEASFNDLVKTAMYAGANEAEADDAAQKTLLDMYTKWPVPGYPLKYARKAVVNNFINSKTRGRDLIDRLIAGGYAPRHEAELATRLDDLEGQERVEALLSVLTASQAEVMRCVMNGFNPTETAELLSKTPGTVRKTLFDARSRLIELLNSDQIPASTTKSSTRDKKKEA